MCSAISGPAIDASNTDDGKTVPSSSPVKASPPPANREEISIHVYMIADKENIPEGASANAIKQFEKKRTFTTYKVGAVAHWRRAVLIPVRQAGEGVVRSFRAAEQRHRRYHSHAQQGPHLLAGADTGIVGFIRRVRTQ